MQGSGKPTTSLSKTRAMTSSPCEYLTIAIADVSNGGEAGIQDAAFANHSESRERLDEFDLACGKKLQSPILGRHYQLDLPTSCLPATILDTSLLHVRFNGIRAVTIKRNILVRVPVLLVSLDYSDNCHRQLYFTSHPPLADSRLCPSEDIRREAGAAAAGTVDFISVAAATFVSVSHRACFSTFNCRALLSGKAPCSVNPRGKYRPRD